MVSVDVKHHVYLLENAKSFRASKAGRETERAIVNQAPGILTFPEKLLSLRDWDWRGPWPSASVSRGFSERARIPAWTVELNYTEQAVLCL